MPETRAKPWSLCERFSADPIVEFLKTHLLQDVARRMASVNGRNEESYERSLFRIVAGQESVSLDFADVFAIATGRWIGELWR